MTFFVKSFFPQYKWLSGCSRHGNKTQVGIKLVLWSKELYLLGAINILRSKYFEKIVRIFFSEFFHRKIEILKKKKFSKKVFNDFQNIT